jgi:hypothetical protein
MARYSAGMLATGAGTTVRPIFAILSTAAITPVLRSIAVVQTTTTACTYRLVHFTAGTAGATAIDENKYRQNSPPALCLAKDLWTADATIGEDTGYFWHLAGAVGSEKIEVFGDTGIEGKLGATAGLGLVPVGTGQIVRVTFVWDE